jgi:dihydrofolate synthase/folylpolyglutamate synthase
MPELLPLSLQHRRPGRIRPQLDGLREALNQLGDPQRLFPSMLIVGTNGKGSAAAMVESVLAAHGLEVGLYTSPHLVRVEERIRIGGDPVGRALLDRQLARLDRFRDLTFFETLTAAAFLAFAEIGVDCAVLEAGMGGRWDATRLAPSEIVGLTNVGSDHPSWLGERMEHRAADKGAALAAARFPVLGPGVEPEVVPHLGAPGARPAADLVRVVAAGRDRARVTWDNSAVEIRAPFPGKHQLDNLQLAVALVYSAVLAGWFAGLEPAAVSTGLAGVRWPGRLSIHRVHGRWVLVDCAHNLEGAEALAGHLADHPALYHLLFSCLDDKPAQAMAEALRPHVGNIVVCPLQDERAMPLERLRVAFPEADVAPSVIEALGMLPSPIVAAGSIRLAGAVVDQSEAVGP